MLSLKEIEDAVNNSKKQRHQGLYFKALCRTAHFQNQLIPGKFLKLWSFHFREVA